ncbi:MAG: Transcription regulator [Parcubacteria bacterium C7867-001]|nr:MAG: Transcription regulator [Parcubacteria bacterium C7867-001]
MSRNQVELEAKLFKGFADQSRLLILSTILGQPKTVSEIVDETKLSQPNTSAHLACLLECGLIRNEKKGREVFYEVSGKEVVGMLQQAQKVLKKHSKEIYECTNY